MERLSLGITGDVSVQGQNVTWAAMLLASRSLSLSALQEFSKILYPATNNPAHLQVV